MAMSQVLYYREQFSPIHEKDWTFSDRIVIIMFKWKRLKSKYNSNSTTNCFCGMLWATKPCKHQWMSSASVSTVGMRSLRKLLQLNQFHKKSITYISIFSVIDPNEWVAIDPMHMDLCSMAINHFSASLVWVLPLQWHGNKFKYFIFCIFSTFVGSSRSSSTGHFGGRCWSNSPYQCNPIDISNVHDDDDRTIWGKATAKFPITNYYSIYTL